MRYYRLCARFPYLLDTLFLGENAKKRQAISPGGKGERLLKENLPEAIKGQARDKLGEKTLKNMLHDQAIFLLRLKIFGCDAASHLFLK